MYGMLRRVVVSLTKEEQVGRILSYSFSVGIPVSSLIEGFVIVKKNPDAAKDEQ